MRPGKDFSAFVSEQAHPQIRLDWYHDRRMVVYTVTGDTTTRSFLDAWYDVTGTILSTWPKNLLYVGIHDTTDAEFSLTPYLRDKATALFQLQRDIRQRVGVVVPNAFNAQMMKVLTRAFGRDTMQTEVFPTREEALIWGFAGLTTNAELGNG